MTNEQSVKYPLSIPAPLYRRLKASAKRNVRTIAGEINVAIQRYLNGNQDAGEAAPEPEQKDTANVS